MALITLMMAQELEFDSSEDSCDFSVNSSLEALFGDTSLFSTYSYDGLKWAYNSQNNLESINKKSRNKIDSSLNYHFTTSDESFSDVGNGDMFSRNRRPISGQKLSRRPYIPYSIWDEETLGLETLFKIRKHITFPRLGCKFWIFIQWNDEIEKELICL